MCELHLVKMGLHDSVRSPPGATHAQDLGGLWRAQREVLADVWTVLRGPERAAVRLALAIAFIDQAMASTAIVNYAPQARPRRAVF